MQHYAVVGNPVSHSKSPFIHSKFAAQTQQNLSYETLEAPLCDFELSVKEFFSDADNKGLNVTVPFKGQAYDLCRQLTTRAQLAGAVNTLFLNAAGELSGDNTDGLGLVKDLVVNHDISLRGKKILILGAGGAVRGVLQPILNELPARVVICNRTLSKVDTLIDMFSGVGLIEKSSFEAIDDSFDLIINGTSASLSGDVPPLSVVAIGAETICYDMMYNKEETVFNQWARTHGAAECIDGLGMLVEQAAEAFFIWRDVRPDTSELIETLRTI